MLLIENEFTIYINGKKEKLKGSGKDNLEALADAVNGVKNERNRTILILKVETINENGKA